MMTAKAYLEELQKREAGIFLEPLQKSAFTEADLREIERELGYALPKEYGEFLQSYQLPNIIVGVSFCGDTFGCSFPGTYSRESNVYLPMEEDAAAVVVDLEWYGFCGKSASGWLEQLKKQAGEMTAWLKAGYIEIGNFYKESYFVFYDLTTGGVLCIHNEDINESAAFSEGWDDPAAVRAAMDGEARTLCRSFHDFLRLACLGESYDEDELIFPGEDKI